MKCLLPLWQAFHVHQKRKQMIHKAAVVFFLSRIWGSLTTSVPLLIITGPGAHLMLFTVNNGLIVVKKKTTPLQRENCFHKCNVLLSFLILSVVDFHSKFTYAHFFVFFESFLSTLSHCYKLLSYRYSLKGLLNSFDKNEI